jgi:Flp pilus assembly protein TadG
MVRLLFSFARNFSKSKGQALVEVTLIFPLLVILVGAAVDWGLGLFVSHVVQNGVREGARVAVTQYPTVNSANVKSVVNSVIPDTPLFSGFRSITNVTCTTSAGLPSVTVQTSGTFNFIFLRILGFAPMPISRSATMYYERESTCTVA